MKKLLLLIILLLIYTDNLYAAEFKGKNFKLDIYAAIYGDFFYNYNKPSNYNNEITHRFSSSALIGESNAGIGFEYKDINLLFEAGLSDYIRKYYLKYNINRDNNHYILIGRDTNLAYYSLFQLANNFAQLNDYGTLAYNRRMQLRYGFKNFHIAMILPYLSDWNNSYSSDSAALYDGYVSIPRIELAYTYKGKYVDLKAFAGYGVYLYEREKQYIVHSAVTGFGSSFVVDEKSSVILSLFYGCNINMTDTLTNSKTINLLNNIFTITNIHSFGVAAGFKYEYNKFLTAQAGVGYTFNYGDNYKSIDDSLGGYINLEISLNKYFSIVPEISLFNRMQSSSEQSEGYDLMAGIVFLLKI